MSTKTFWDFMYNSDKQIEESERKMALEDIVSDEELKEVFYGTIFDLNKQREILDKGVSKMVNGWWNGFTLNQILHELDLICVPSFAPKPTKKGLAYYNLLPEDLKIKFKK